MARPAGTRFLITYGPIPRIWCEACDEATALPNLETGTAQLVEAEHRRAHDPVGIVLAAMTAD